MSLLARIDRDVLAEPDVGTVVINEGLQDLLQDGVNGNGVDNLTTAYSQLITILAGYGITVVFDTLTPCYRYIGTGSTPDSCANAVTSATYGSMTVDAARQQVLNQWIGNNTSNLEPQLIMEADTDCFVAASCGESVSPEQLAASATTGASYDEGDHVNLSPAGYAQAATAITPSDLYPPAFPS
jgi:hypothetical protein